MSSFKRLADAGDLTGKTALVRVDFNVPMENGLVTDDTRLRAAIDTVQTLRTQGAKVALLAHFGRPKGERVADMSLAPIAGAFAKVLGSNVSFIADCKGEHVKQAIADLDPAGVILLENTRFYAGEEKGDPELAKEIAALGDIYVNDAFSAAHRKHVSTAVLATLLPAYAGVNMEAELDALDKALGTPERPVLAVVGGAKVSSKIDLLKNLVTQVDSLAIGGGMALGSKGLGVKVEAKFDVAEYNVVILSAKESNGLETWLKQEKYNIPKGAGPLLKPYVEGGQYFFAAKVDPKKVKFKDGQAQLSPLRFHYDSKDFSLPVRLGLINANGPQDLLVHILARGQRYEVANYPNVTIPTNLIVKADVKKRFSHFYTTLFDRVLEETPGAVVTEYSWNANTCDPCPTPALNGSEIRTLGEDVLGNPSTAGAGRGGFIGLGGGWVLTRLHARYTADTMKEDLVFQKAEPIVGGRGMPHGIKVIEQGILGEQRAIPSSMNNFQGRYIILNPWEGEIKCEDPTRGRWGGPVNGATSKPTAAQDTAFIKDRKAFKLSDAIVTKQVSQIRDLDGTMKTVKVAADDTIIEEETSDGVATISQGKPGDGAGATPAQAKKSEQKSSCATGGALDRAPRTPLVALLFALGALLGIRRRERR